MTLYDFITRGKLFFDMAHSYAQASQKYGIRDPLEAIVTFGYKHLEKQEALRENPQVLDALRKAFGGMYENFEKNISSEQTMVVVHGRRTIDQEVSEN